MQSIMWFTFCFQTFDPRLRPLTGDFNPPPMVTTNDPRHQPRAEQETIKAEPTKDDLPILESRDSVQDCYIVVYGRPGQSPNEPSDRSRVVVFLRIHSLGKGLGLVLRRWRCL